MYDDDDGPGCGGTDILRRVHPASCLCDVDLSLLEKLPPKRDSIQDWWDEFDRMYQPRLARMSDDIVGDARALWHEQASAENCRAKDRARPVTALLSRHYEPAEIAEAFGTTVEVIMSAVTQAPTAAAIEAIRLLRLGKSRYAVAHATGIHSTSVGRLAVAIGKPKGRKGGASTAKYTDDQVREVLSRRERGQSWGHIAKVMGLGKPSVAVGIARRSARVTQ